MCSATCCAWLPTWVHLHKRPHPHSNRSSSVQLRQLCVVCSGGGEGAVCVVVALGLWGELTSWLDCSCGGMQAGSGGWRWLQQQQLARACLDLIIVWSSADRAFRLRASGAAVLCKQYRYLICAACIVRAPGWVHRRQPAVSNRGGGLQWGRRGADRGGGIGRMSALAAA